MGQHPAQAVEIGQGLGEGMKNDETPLNDTTGARRTWLLEQTSVPAQNLHQRIIAHRDLLWAEANAAHEVVVPWWLEHDDTDAPKELEAR